MVTYLQEMTLKIEDLDCTFYSVYLPHNQNQALFILNTLHNRLKTKTQHRVIIAGDFNCTLNLETDRINSPERYRDTCRRLNELTKDQNLEDMWTRNELNEAGFTFIKQNPPSASRIDRIYCNMNISPNFISIKTVPSFSDNLAVELRIATIQERQNPPYWRFNNDMLHDENCIKYINKYIKTYTEENHINMDPIIRWENLKYNIRDH